MKDMGFTTHGKYDAIDMMELDIDTDVEAGGNPELLASLVTGKTTDKINLDNVIKMIKERVPSEAHEECIKIIQKRLGIILSKEELAA